MSIGKDSKGKYRQKNRNFTGAYTQAQAAIAQLVEEVSSGFVVAKSTHTFNTYMNHFIKTRKMSGEVAEGTVRVKASPLIHD